jgi:hypothetical protein
MLSDTNRGGIRESIKQWSQRQNIPDDVLNDFIEIALNKANRALRIPPLESYQAILVSDTGYIELPSDYIEVKELKIPYGNDVLQLQRSSIHDADELGNTTGTIPRYFGRFGNFFRIAPWTLGDEVLAELYYYRALPPLLEDTSFNWFTQYSPETLLYGSLAELGFYTRDPQFGASWSEKFENGINLLQGVEDKAEWSGSTIAVTPSLTHRR